MNNTGIGIITIRMIMYSLFYAVLMHKTQITNKRIKRSSVTNQYAMSLEDGISAWKYSI